ncbi:hypothetical protein [Actinoplanes sp. NPDC051851]|uniref:hypothetical protein n=1 Tax=Actinoplanes sp. NPDC051851 TaxID=3154753 RepID=UPI003437D1BE
MVAALFAAMETAHLPVRFRDGELTKLELRKLELGKEVQVTARRRIDRQKDRPRR